MQIHFVFPGELLEQIVRVRIGRGWEHFPYWLDGRAVWTVQTWLVLREFREGLTIGPSPMPNRMNFAHGRIWRAIGARSGEFRVSARADYPRLFDVDVDIVQNPVVARRRHELYLPHWPVPGQMPRDPARRGVTTIAYAGRLGRGNLAPSLRNERKMSPLSGLELRVISPDRWHDLSDVDVLFAVRSFDRRPYSTKPPSKLFNAWRANIPLVAGWDSAYSAIGRVGVDYIRIDSERGMLDAIARLRDEPAYYDAIVAAGRARAEEVSHEAIAQEWLRTFDGPIVEAFDRWSPPGRRPLANTLDRTRNFASRLRRAAQATSAAAYE